MIVYLDTSFELGDIVCHRSNKELKFIVTGFLVGYTVVKNKCTDYLVQCSDGYELTYLAPFEIEEDKKLDN